MQRTAKNAEIVSIPITAGEPKMINKKLSQEVLAVLSTAEINGLTVRLTCGQLDRKLYQDVNFALESLGGKWNRKSKGHDFTSDPNQKLDDAILTGEVTPPTKNGYFPTPKAIVQELIEIANIKPDMLVLEPSAGQGAIAEEIHKTNAKLVCCEILPENIKVLKAKGLDVAAEDFFQFNEFGKFDRVVMNPPFDNQADIDHVIRAYDMLKPNGLLVSIMSLGVVFRQNKKTVQFRNFVENNNGRTIELPEDSFKESGTGVNTVIIVIPKEAY